MSSFPAKSKASPKKVLVKGLSGILTRTVMRALRMVGRSSSPWRVFDSCPEAAGWIAQHLDGHVGLRWSTAEVLAVLTQASIPV